MASNQPSTIDFEVERRSGVRKRLEPFTVRTPFGPDLAYLVELLAAGGLDSQIGVRTSWNDVSEAAEALLDRRVAGKAVLDVAGWLTKVSMRANSPSREVAGEGHQ